MRKRRSDCFALEVFLPLQTRFLFWLQNFDLHSHAGLGLQTGRLHFIGMGLHTADFHSSAWWQLAQQPP